MALRLNKLGRRSLTLDIEAHAHGAVRMRCQQVMVQTSLRHDHSIDMPADVRHALEALCHTKEALA